MPSLIQFNSNILYGSTAVDRLAIKREITSISAIDENFESNILTFNSAETDDFHSWSLHAKTLLQAKQLDRALEGKDVSSTSSKKALTMIVTSLGCIPPRVIESYDSDKKAWDRLQMRYGGKTFLSTLPFLSNTLTGKLRRRTDIGDRSSILYA